MKNLFLFSVMTLLLTGFSHAGILIEPLAGYNVSSKFDDEGGGRGFAYGGRVGFQAAGFQLGVDYLKSTFTGGDMEEVKNDVETNELGAFVGYRFLFPLRVYAGYIISANSNDIEIEQDDGTVDTMKLLKGSGAKFGMSFILFPYVSLNLEMRNTKFKEADLYDESSDTKFTGEKIDLKTSAYLVSLSIPFGT